MMLAKESGRNDPAWPTYAPPAAPPAVAWPFTAAGFLVE
jgi:hypothetical protein